MAENNYAPDPGVTLEELVEEMRSIQRVAGQCSVEGPEGAMALIAAAEAERAGRWADILEAALARRASLPTAQEAVTDEEVEALRRSARPLDCGAHYCRYCPAGTHNQWAHTPSCPYVESQQDAELVRTLHAKLAASRSIPAPTPDADPSRYQC